MGLFLPQKGRVPQAGEVLAAVDLGSTKACCLIARVGNQGQFHLLGAGYCLSRGLQNGHIIDMAEASRTLGMVVTDAEKMSGEVVRDIIINVPAHHVISHQITSESQLNGMTVHDKDIRKSLMQARGVEKQGAADIIHLLPTSYTIDGRKGIKDPVGLSGHHLAVSMHVVTAQASALRNLRICAADSHLQVSHFCLTPLAAGLSCMVEDEQELGAIVIDMGGSTTQFAIFNHGAMVYADSVPVGGMHVTSDIAKGLTTTVGNAERIKTLYGSALATSTDEREMIDVPTIGEGDDGHANPIPRSLLVEIIRPRIEEIFEMVRQRLEESGFFHLAGRRVVLTGGASQLSGVRDLAQMILDRHVRQGKPLNLSYQLEGEAGPAYSVAAGLLNLGRDEKHLQYMNTALQKQGVFSRVQGWLKENL
ncbi:MAG: cell division protein FtsA [Alphaproteobacteria bacterium]